MRTETKTVLLLLMVVSAIVGCSRSNTEITSELPPLPVVRGSELQDFVSRSDKPVLVEFGVDYQCDRCRQMKDGIAELAEKFEGRAAVVRVDFNSNATLVSQFGGTICPTYVFFRDGQAVKTESFPVSADILESELAKMTEPVSE